MYRLYGGGRDVNGVGCDERGRFGGSRVRVTFNWLQKAIGDDFRFGTLAQRLFHARLGSKKKVFAHKCAFIEAYFCVAFPSPVSARDADA